jgi:hypothetical protein
MEAERRARGLILAAIYTVQAGDGRFRFSGVRAAARGLAVGWEFFALGGTSRAEQSRGAEPIMKSGVRDSEREAL